VRRRYLKEEEGGGRGKGVAVGGERREEEEEEEGREGGRRARRESAANLLWDKAPRRWKPDRDERSESALGKGKSRIGGGCRRRKNSQREKEGSDGCLVGGREGRKDARGVLDQGKEKGAKACDSEDPCLKGDEDGRKRKQGEIVVC